MDIKEAISLALQASLFLLVLSLGLESRTRDIFYVLCRPALLLRALVAVNVIVPAAAIAMCILLPIAPCTKAGLIMMAVSPVAPFAPLKMLKREAERSYVIGTYVALMVCAVVVVPLTVELLRAFAPQDLKAPVPLVAAFVVETVLLPLTAGIMLHAQWDRLSERAAPIARRAALIILVPASLLILVRFARDFLSLIGDGTLVAILVIVAAGLLAGYALGGPEAANRKALGDAAAARHPGLAAAIAQLNFGDSRVLTAIVLYLFASILFTLACGWAVSELKAHPIRLTRTPHP